MTTAMPSQPTTDEKDPPKGALSFCYNALYTPAITSICKQDVQKLLALFDVAPGSALYNAALSVQSLGASNSINADVFNDCIAYISQKYQGKDELQGMLNALNISQSICEELSENYKVIW